VAYSFPPISQVNIDHKKPVLVYPTLRLLSREWKSPVLLLEGGPNSVVKFVLPIFHTGGIKVELHLSFSFYTVIILHFFCVPSPNKTSEKTVLNRTPSKEKSY
jgi:hypothetical protein